MSHLGKQECQNRLRIRAGLRNPTGLKLSLYESVATGATGLWSRAQGYKVYRISVTHHFSQ